MKKVNFYVLGMSAMVLALGLVLVGCPNETTGPDTGPKSIKITGINKTDIKANAQVDVNAGDMSIENGQGSVAAGASDIANQTLSVDLCSWLNGVNGEWSEDRWTGNGTWCIRLELRSSADNHRFNYLWKNWQKYNIKDAVTELNFADFVLVYEEDH
jgi:hypothetical protein